MLPHTFALPSSDAVAYQDLPGTKTDIAMDACLKLIPKFQELLEHLEGMSDDAYCSFLCLAVHFSWLSDRLWKKDLEGHHRLVPPRRQAHSHPPGVS